ncbi:MAG TPA: hypothetical protein VK338_05355 [Candidatus Nitrosocosmicus sp.]|nr:hypothetical protein [Candidatus Nitrosocosmicus sp.]
MPETAVVLPTDVTSKYSEYPLIADFQRQCLEPWENFISHEKTVLKRTGAKTFEGNGKEVEVNEGIITEITVRQLSEVIFDTWPIRHAPTPLDQSGFDGISKGGDVMVGKCLIDATKKKTCKKFSLQVNHLLDWPVLKLSIWNMPWYDENGEEVGINKFIEETRDVIVKGEDKVLWQEDERTRDSWPAIAAYKLLCSARHCRERSINESNVGSELDQNLSDVEERLEEFLEDRWQLVQDWYESRVALGYASVSTQ